jgi:hypothetical protein
MAAEVYYQLDGAVSQFHSGGLAAFLGSVAHMQYGSSGVAAELLQTDSAMPGETLQTSPFTTPEHGVSAFAGLV